MDILKVAQRADVLIGIVFAILGGYWLANGNSLVGVMAVLSAVVSFASAKYVPARWLAKRLLLARLRSAN